MSRRWCLSTGRRLSRLQTAVNLTVLGFLVYNVFVFVTSREQAAIVRVAETSPPLERPLALLTSSAPQTTSDPLLGGVLPAAAATAGRLGPVDHWRNVTYSQGKFFIFSAYYDRRGSRRVVRVIATGRYRLQDAARPLSCLLTFANGSQVPVAAEHKVIRENFGLQYTARFVICPSEQPPLQVAMFEGKNPEQASAAISVQDTLPSNPRLGEFSVCVKPFHYDWNRAVWLVEFLEFHRLLGVSHFVFYNHTLGADVERVVRFYQKLGLITVMPWQIALRSQKEVRTENMFAALNDCAYRTMYRYNYTLLVDVDEYIVPRQHQTYPQLLQLLAARGKQQYGSFVFQNCFFYLYWENDTAVAEQLHLSPKQEQDFPYLLTLYKTRRMRTPHRFFSRSKYLVMPERVVEVGNHQVWEHISGYKPMSVGEHFGLVHHYRICEFGGFDCMKKPSMVDRTTHKYIKPLATQVLTVCAAIFGAHCPEAPPLGSPW